MIPPPFAVVSVGLATLPISMFLSVTVKVVELTVVVVPLTVKVPVMVAFPPMVASPDVARLVSVPTLVSEEVTTEELRVVPVRVPAAAFTVMLAEPSNDTPLIVRPV